VTATSEDIATLGAAIEADPQLEVKVDVEKARVFFGDSNFTVHIPDTAQDALVSGRWDPIAELLENAEKVDVCLEKMGFASK
jgi:3-isopropylmalate/(R)-2-methylmalate dehydratase small subunit